LWLLLSGIEQQNPVPRLQTSAAPATPNAIAKFLLMVLAIL